jgi:hypothetical protein
MSRVTGLFAFYCCSSVDESAMWGNAHWGHVETPPNFREIHGGWGDVGVPSIGGLVSKIIKKK